jgi:hypothetical protein
MLFYCTAQAWLQGLRKHMFGDDKDDKKNKRVKYILYEE